MEMFLLASPVRRKKANLVGAFAPNATSQGNI